jgi:hypothetical protein
VPQDVLSGHRRAIEHGAAGYFRRPRGLKATQQAARLKGVF